MSGARLELIRTINNIVFEVRVEAASAARFVLRIHRRSFRTVAETRSELLFLQALHERLAGTDVRVPRPVAAADGDLVVEVPDPEDVGVTHHCDLLTWIDGRPLRPGSGLGTAATRLLGVALGRLHSFAAEFEPPPDFALPRWDADAMFTAASPYRPGDLRALVSPAEWRLVEQLEEDTRAVFDRLDREEGTIGVIHADFILSNCHFARRGRHWNVGVLDFDDLGWGYFLYDLSPLLGNLAEFPDYAARRRAFLEGYRSVRSLPSAYEAYLPVLMAARHAATCAWVAGIHRTGKTSPPLAEHLAYRLEAIRHCLRLPSST